MMVEIETACTLTGIGVATEIGTGIETEIEAGAEMGINIGIAIETDGSL